MVEFMCLLVGELRGLSLPQCGSLLVSATFWEWEQGREGGLLLSERIMRVWDKMCPDQQRKQQKLV